MRSGVGCWLSGMVQRFTLHNIFLFRAVARQTVNLNLSLGEGFKYCVCVPSVSCLIYVEDLLVLRCECHADCPYLTFLVVSPVRRRKAS